MKIPYRWIREFVDLDLTAEQAADRLINAGVEVASVAPLAPELRGVVVGEIEAIERELGESHGHRLVLCRVATGRERFSVVCGAPNAALGVRAAFAPPGAVLPGDRRIASAKIRGTESQGMLCSERELGLGDEHERGILTVDADTPLGTNLVAHLGNNGAVQARLEASAAVAASRGDALEKSVSKEADADLTQTLVHLSQTQNAYQAALQSGARLLSTSLLDYLH